MADSRASQVNYNRKYPKANSRQRKFIRGLRFRDEDHLQVEAKVLSSTVRNGIRYTIYSNVTESCD